MRSKKDFRAMLEDMLLERGVRLIAAEETEEFIDELDELIGDLITVRLEMVMLEGTCGNPNCPVHGTAVSKPATSDPSMN